MRKLLKGITGVVLMAAVIETASFAGTSYGKYNTVVGRFNGNGYSDYQTKVTAGADGYIKSESVGGNYVVDVRMQSSAGNGAWLRDLDDGTKAYLPGTSNQKKGCSVRAQFSNDWCTPVTVQVKGEWKSN